jgi:hypothetical protein
MALDLANKSIAMDHNVVTHLAILILAILHFNTIFNAPSFCPVYLATEPCLAPE